jgi:60 kDa SS-A/Ro ribonucleoprotein
MRTNRPAPPTVLTRPLTHEGAPAVRITPRQALRRASLACLLFEDTFYKSGSSVGANIAALVPQCKPEDVAALAVEARDTMYLRHLPLFLVRELARIKGTGALVAATLEHVIQRADEMGEYLSLYWRGAKDDKDKPPLSAGSKRGLARAFRKFNAYALAKYDRDGAVKLRDVLRLTHAKPESREQGEMWKQVIARTLPPPNTWETRLSAGADKKAVFEDLLRTNQLGGLAFLRNLRNMEEAHVDPALVRERFAGDFKKVLPFRFIAAVRHAPKYTRELDAALLRAAADLPKIDGETIILVDVSGSMNDPLSKKSEMTRLDAASALAVMATEITPDCRVFSFSGTLKAVPAYRGLGLVDAIDKSQPHGNTYLGRAVETLTRLVPTAQRLIVVTDEQARDAMPAMLPWPQRYLINIACNEHGVGYHNGWVHIDGWSERVFDFLVEHERETAEGDRS